MSGIVYLSIAGVRSFAPDAGDQVSAIIIVRQPSWVRLMRPAARSTLTHACPPPRIARSVVPPSPHHTAH